MNISFILSIILKGIALTYISSINASNAYSMKRAINFHLQQWANQSEFKPLLLRGARQVGKTHAVRELGKSFEHFVEINFEKYPELQKLFDANLSPERIVNDIQYITKQKIIPGKTLLFFDNIHLAPECIIALRYFYEEIPNLHIIAASAFMDFAIELVGVPVGRIQFIYMYPMSFLEFLHALDEHMLINEMRTQQPQEPINAFAHDHLITLIKEYLAIGGMPEVVKSWVQKKDASKCLSIQQSLIDTYRQDFNKYAKKKSAQISGIIV